MPSSQALRFDVAADHARPVMPAGARRGTMRAARVGLPLHANGETEIQDAVSNIGVRFVLEGARDAGVELVDGVALYPSALDGADIVHRAHVEGTEDYVAFETRPPREQLRYSVDVTRVAGLRLVHRTLEFLDTSGTPMIRVAPPYVVDARGERHDADLAVAGCAYDTSPVGPWGRPVTAPGANRCSVIVSWHGVPYPALVDPAWTTTGSMVLARRTHTAERLPSGRVLIVGGIPYPATTAPAELFDPGGSAGAGTFAVTGTPAFHVFEIRRSVALPSGKVLVLGGLGRWLAPTVPTGGAVDVAEIYDPSTGTFTATAKMMQPRQQFTASLMTNGKVLVAGGVGRTGQGDTAEIFDPAGDGGAGSFSFTASMEVERYDHAATALPSGMVVVSGGGGVISGTRTASAEVFDPTGNAGAGKWTTIAMGEPRERHTSTLLANGKVLVAGGTRDTTQLKSAEIYTPIGNGGVGSFSPAGPMGGMAIARTGHAASLLPSGLVLVTGANPAELFDPAGNGGAGTFGTTAPMTEARSKHTSTTLLSGRVLVTGGSGQGQSAEIFGGTLGDGCTTDSNCYSGHCVDGVCCATACAGACESCAAASKQSGTGSGTCGPAKQGTSCGGGCASTKVTTKTCDAAGVCQAKTSECAPFLCASAATATCTTGCTNDGECSSEAWCSAGKCAPKAAPGAPCASASACASNACVDGYCGGASAPAQPPPASTSPPGGPPAGDATAPAPFDTGCNVALGSRETSWVGLVALLGAFAASRRRRRAEVAR